MKAHEQIRVFEARRLANDEIQNEPYKKYGLRLVRGMPVYLPDGWRFVYESYFQDMRVWQVMVLVFVSKQGEVCVEWDDFREEPNRLTRIITNINGDITALATIQPESSKQEFSDHIQYADAFNLVRDKFTEMIVESAEEVWNAKDNMSTKCWRFGLRHGIYRYRVLVGATSDKPVGELKQQWRSVASRVWTLPPCTYEANTLTVSLQDAVLRGQWTVWSCMAHATHFTRTLGYSDVAPYNIFVEFNASDVNTAGAAFDDSSSIPTLNFVAEGGWAEDPTIVLHELGHALWSLLYTRIPRCIDHKTYEKQLKGVQEGFADYFAATQWAHNDDTVKIGEHVDAETGQNYKLPRMIQSKRFTPPEGTQMEDDPHFIGNQWANLLWNLRFLLGKDDTDPIVLKAHLRPCITGSGPREPLAAYFQSLQETAQQLLRSNVWATVPWKELARTHQIPVTSLLAGRLPLSNDFQAEQS